MRAANIEHVILADSERIPTDQALYALDKNAANHVTHLALTQAF